MSIHGTLKLNTGNCSHNRFTSRNVFQTKGSETPAHHGTVQALHLHDPHGIEPPFSELPIEHGKSHASQPASTAAQTSSPSDSSFEQQPSTGQAAM